MNKNAIGKRHGPRYDIFQAIISNKVTLVCLVFVIILIFIACTVDLYFDYDTDVIGQNPAEGLISPCKEYPFGTDAFGRNYFARIVYGTRITLVIALVVNILAAAISIVLGGLSAYYGGWFDTLLMRLIDSFLAIPTLLFIICIVAALGNSIVNIILALVIVSLPGLIRTARSAFMVSMQNEYVEAAHACGTRDLKIIFSHLLPNSLGPILVSATMNISSVILATAGMGYLGLGIKQPAPEWGRMLSEAQQYMRNEPYLIIIPGLILLITATVFNLLGDGIRDAIDPRLRGFRKRKQSFSGRRKKNASK